MDFPVPDSVVSYDYPHHALLEEVIAIDFVNSALGLGARVTVEITRASAPHPLAQDAPRRAQHLLGPGRTIVALQVTNEGEEDSQEELTFDMIVLRSVSGGIVRDRRTTAQRSCQGSRDGR